MNHQVAASTLSIAVRCSELTRAACTSNKNQSTVYQ